MGDFLVKEKSFEWCHCRPFSPLDYKFNDPWFSARRWASQFLPHYIPRSYTVRESGSDSSPRKSPITQPASLSLRRSGLFRCVCVCVCMCACACVCNVLTWRTTLHISVALYVIVVWAHIDKMYVIFFNTSIRKSGVIHGYGLVWVSHKMATRALFDVWHQRIAFGGIHYHHYLHFDEGQHVRNVMLASIHVWEILSVCGPL